MRITGLNRFAVSILLLTASLVALAPMVFANSLDQVVTFTQTILSTEPSCVATQTGVGFTAVISFCGTTVNTAVTLTQSETAWITTSQLVIIVIAVALVSFGLGYIASNKLRK